MKKVRRMRHKEWRTWKGTWYIAYQQGVDVFTIILNNPRQYGIIEDWEDLP